MCRTDPGSPAGHAGRTPREVADGREPTDRTRRAARRAATLDTVCRLEAGRGVGLVWNISTGSVRMLLPEQPEPGATLKGELVTADLKVTLPVSIRVSHVSRLR